MKQVIYLGVVHSTCKAESHRVLKLPDTRSDYTIYSEPAHTLKKMFNLYKFQQLLLSPFPRTGYDGLKPVPHPRFDKVSIKTNTKLKETTRYSLLIPF